MTAQVAVVLQQLVNGLSLGMMYALLALGFTMVYGIIELINFAHFNVFMSGTFFGLWFLALLGYGRTSRPLEGITLILYASNFANNVPYPTLVPNQRWSIFGTAVEITLKNVLLWISALLLMFILD